jgi:hypothetical protein
MGMREKLIELLRCEDRCPESLEHCGEDCPYFDISKAYCCDEDTATADMLIANGVTIPVRCKECKGWCSEEIAKHYGVDRYCTMTMMPTNADDYCSCGERRTDE